MPQIRAELGPDAIVVRQREGIVGGVGGFFGKRCVEVEAQAPWPMPSETRAVPARSVIDAYAPTRVFEAVLAQAEPFIPAQPEADWECEWDWQAAPELPPEAEAEAEPEPEPDLATEPELELEVIQLPLPAPIIEPEPLPELEPAAVVEELPPPPPPPAVATLLEQLGPIENDDFASIRTEMLAAALPVRLVGDILSDVEQHLLPFEPGASRRSLARRALAGRIKTANGWRTKQRTVAVVGMSGSGRTLTTASLAAAYAAAGKTVTALSLEPAREAMRLAELLGEREEIDFEIVDAPARVRSARKRLTAPDVIVADMPPAEAKATLPLLRALEPDETHLVMPSGMTSTEGQAMLNMLGDFKLPTRIVITHADDQRPSGAAVGLAVAHRIPVSFLGQGARVGRLQPAEPEALARMVLR